jgi:hypothetical protein
MKTIDMNALENVTGAVGAMLPPTSRYVQLSTRKGSGWAANLSADKQHIMITKPGAKTHELTLVPSGTSRF